MNACYKSNIFDLKDLLSATADRISKNRSCGSKTIREIKEIQLKYNYLNKKYGVKVDSEEKEDLTSEKVKISELQCMLTKYNILSIGDKIDIQNEIIIATNNLSTRAKNVLIFYLNSVQLEKSVKNVNSELPLYCNGEILIHLIYGTIDFLNIKNCGLKSVGEIKQFISASKEILENKINNQTNPDIAEEENLDTGEEQFYEIINQFNFLSQHQLKSITSFFQDNKVCPYLDILYSYINALNDNKSKICKLYYGLDDTREYTLEELSYLYKLSKERIRQIVDRKISIPAVLDSYLRNEVLPFIGDFVSNHSEVLQSLCRDSHIIDPNQVFNILSLTLLDYRMIKIHADTNIRYLVNKKVIENINIKSIISNIRYRFELKRVSLERINLYDYISEMSKEKKEKVVSFLIDCFKTTWGIIAVDNRYLFAMPNSVDISLAIENILKDNGNPMSLNELFQDFNSLYPSHSLDNPLKLKPYIFRNENIKSKGKTGVYILKSWSNHFTGTLTSYIEHILRTFKEPILMDDLVDFAIEQFPKTNKKSVYSLIIGDKEDRFVVYEGEYVGLAIYPISEKDLKERRIFKRQNFDSRLEDLRQFISTWRRLPIQTGTEEEKSLSRWISNVLKSKIDITEDQVNKLKKILLENKTIPQNGTEYGFKQMCDQIRVIVAQSFSLPKLSDNRSEYLWLKKNLEKYLTYEDNRKLYFEELLSYLRNYGFYL